MFKWLQRLFSKADPIEYEITAKQKQEPVMIKNAVTDRVIRAAMPRIKDDWLRPIKSAFLAKGLTGSEACLLIAHIGHESSDLARLVENMNYSADRLMVVWPSRFKTIERAMMYERNAEKLANEVYGSRMGNTDPGDGWRFRGRGPIQITGRNNYNKCGRAIGRDLLTYPDILATDKSAGIESAIWYWQTQVRHHDIEGSTRDINGGLNGLDDRNRRYNAAMRALS